MTRAGNEPEGVGARRARCEHGWPCPGGRSVTSTRKMMEDQQQPKNPRSKWLQDPMVKGRRGDRLAKMAEGWGRYGARSGLWETQPSTARTTCRTNTDAKTSSATAIGKETSRIARDRPGGLPRVTATSARKTRSPDDSSNFPGTLQAAPQRPFFRHRPWRASSVDVLSPTRDP
jgi:hypothetical protein